MVPLLHYNKLMKKRLNKTKKVMTVLLMVCWITGCGKTEGTADVSLNTQTAESQADEENTSVNGRTESDVAGGAMSGENGGTVRIALIDTGLSTQAIPKENIVDGKNYLYPDASTEDTYGHGTAVASVILQYAPDARIVPLVSNAYEDGKIKQVENDTFAEMIRDAADVYHCKIINISAGLILDKESVRDAVYYAEEQGVLIVASAGNDYESNGEAVCYPAAYDTVLSVGALNSTGEEIASFSQRGDWVDVYAVGENITIKTLSGNTRTSEGTSYSAAIVTAEAARLLSSHPEYTPADLRMELKKTFAEK